MRDAEGNWEMMDLPNGEQGFRYRAVVYKRVDKVKLPNGLTPADYTIAMRERQIADNTPTPDTEDTEG